MNVLPFFRTWLKGSTASIPGHRQQLSKELESGNTRKILANFYNKREWVYSVGELLPLPSQNSPKFMLTKALVSVPDRAFPRGKHEWVVRFGNETSGLNEVSPPFHLRTIKLLDSRVHSLTNSWLPGLHSITLASPKALPWQSLRAGNAVTWIMIWIRTVSC